MRHVTQKTDSRLARCVATILIFCCAGGAPVQAEDLQPKTVEAFDSYVHLAEARIDAEPTSGGSFLWIERLPAQRRAKAEAQLRAGEVVIERLDESIANGGEIPGNAIDVPGGMIHDWIGTVFIPGGTLTQTLALEEDYDHHQDYFHPDVMRSKILWHDGNDFTIEMRLYKKKVVSAVLETQHEVRYNLMDATHAWSRSWTTNIQEVGNPGEAKEKLDPAGHDRGFLWRMNTYWRFEEKDGGTYVECRAISLTRDIPTGLGWLVGSYVSSIPRESLTFTLATTRGAVLKRMGSSAHAQK